MKKINGIIVLFISLLVSQYGHAQMVIEEAGYEIISTFAVPGDLNSELGTIMFSADGDTVFVLDGSEDTESTVSSASVTRDGSGNVTSFGAFTEVFMYDYLDTGLEYGPGTDTLFFKIYPGNESEDEGMIGQRLSGGAIETTEVSGYDGDYGGLAFIPGTFTNGGNLVTGAYNEYYSLWLHQVSPDGDGSFTVNPAGTLYATFENTTGHYYVSDLIFITSGPLAGNAMVALYNGYDSEDESDTLLYFPVGADGLPVGGVDVTPTVFASGYTGAWGVAMDPITNNIWMIDYDETDGIALTQIAEEQAVVGGTAVGVTAVPVLSPAFLGALVLLLLGVGWIGIGRRSA
jgi:hypothetical protein